MNNYSTLMGVRLEEAIKRLDAQLEPKAYKAILGGKGAKLNLTDINPGFLPPAMTEIFGAFGFGWGFEVVEDGVEKLQIERKNGYVDTEYQAWAKVAAWYKIYQINDEQNHITLRLPAIPGASANSQREWATKGAITNALGTSLFFLGWQSSVYQGKRSHKKDEPGTHASMVDDDLSVPIQGEEAPAPNSPAPTPQVTALKVVDSQRKNAGYVVQFGKHKGLALAEVPDPLLSDTLRWAEAQPEPGVNVVAFMEMARVYLKSSELNFDKKPESAAPPTTTKPPPKTRTRKKKPAVESKPASSKGSQAEDLLRADLAAEPVDESAEIPWDVRLTATSTLSELKVVVNEIANAYSTGALSSEVTNKLYRVAEDHGVALKQRG